VGFTAKKEFTAHFILPAAEKSYAAWISELLDARLSSLRGEEFLRHFFIFLLTFTMINSKLRFIL
jgi:hypothetical protein